MRYLSLILEGELELLEYVVMGDEAGVQWDAEGSGWHEGPRGRCGRGGFWLVEPIMSTASCSRKTRDAMRRSLEFILEIANH